MAASTTRVTAAGPCLVVQGLTVRTAHGRRLLDGLQFALAPGERVAVVGASGAGKSMLSLALLGLLRPPLMLQAGAAWLHGQDLLAMSRQQRHALRGTGIFLVFQSPGALLDPMLSIGFQLRQTALRSGIDRAALTAAVHSALASVRLAESVLALRAVQLSGGMKQRVLIAMALLLKPGVLIADEPTSGLDDATAHGVLQALDAAQRSTGSALLLVTHDLRLAQAHADRVLVLDAGRLVEDAPIAAFLSGQRSAAGRALVDAAQYLNGVS
jgi:ABC-type glutathione transport system ATPase component